MSHLMTDGRPCGLPDGHCGYHRSPESIERKKRYDRFRVCNGYHNDLEFRKRKIESDRLYFGTAKGMIARMRSGAKRRGNR